MSAARKSYEIRQLLDALRCKSQRRGFLQIALRAGDHSSSNRDQFQESSWGQMHPTDRRITLTASPQSVSRPSIKYGNLDVWQFYRSPRRFTGRATILANYGSPEIISSLMSFFPMTRPNLSLRLSADYSVTMTEAYARVLPSLSPIPNFFLTYITTEQQIVASRWCLRSLLRSIKWATLEEIRASISSIDCIDCLYYRKKHWGNMEDWLQ